MNNTTRAHYTVHHQPTPKQTPTTKPTTTIIEHTANHTNHTNRLADHKRLGGHSGKATPGPIPNPEAKTPSANGTAPARVWESRTPPSTHPRDEAPNHHVGGLPTQQTTTRPVHRRAVWVAPDCARCQPRRISGRSSVVKAADHHGAGLACGARMVFEAGVSLHSDLTAALKSPRSIRSSWGTTCASTKNRR